MGLVAYTSGAEPVKNSKKNSKRNAVYTVQIGKVSGNTAKKLTKQ